MSKRNARRFYELARDWLDFGRRGCDSAFTFFLRYRRMAREERRASGPVYVQNEATWRWERVNIQPEVASNPP